MDWIGDDGQRYDSWDKWKGANNRYRQQQEQNQLLKEQNQLIREQEENRKREKAYEENTKRAKKAEEEISGVLSDLYDFKDLFDTYHLQKITDFNELKLFLINTFEIANKSLQSDITNFIYNFKEQEEIQNEECITDFDKFFKNGMMKFVEEPKQKYVIKLNILKKYIEQIKKTDINNSIVNSLEELYNTMINEYKKQLQEIKQEIKLQLNEYKYFPEYASTFDSLQDFSSEYTEMLKKAVARVKENQNKKVNLIKKDIDSTNNEIKKVNEKIKLLNQATTLTDVSKIKEIIASVDYEFLKEILGNTYSTEELVLLIKGHIKNIEPNIEKLSNKKYYYETLLFLVENETYTNIFDYETFDEIIDYKKNFENILEYEKEKSKEQEELKEKQKKEEEQKKIQLEQQKKEEEQKRIQLEQQKKEEEQKRIQLEQQEKKEEEEKKNKSNKKVIIGVIVSCAVVVLIGIIMFLVLKMNNKQTSDNVEISEEQTVNNRLISITGNEEEDKNYYYNACSIKMYDEIAKHYSTEKITNLTQITGIRIEDKEKSNRFLITATVFNKDGNQNNLMLYDLYKSNPNAYSSASYIEKLIIGHECIAIIEIDSMKLKQLYDNDIIHNDAENIQNEKEEYLSTINDIEFINITDMTMSYYDNVENSTTQWVNKVNEELKRLNWIGDFLDLNNNEINSSNNNIVEQENNPDYYEDTTNLKNEQSNMVTSSNNSQSSSGNSSSSDNKQNDNSNNNDYNDYSNNGNNNQPQEKNIQMPNVIGMSTSQAEQKLNELGIAYNISSITSLSKDNVFYQSVSAGTSKPKSQFGTVTLKAYRKVTQVSANITISSSNYNGKTIKVLINGKECKDMMGNTTFNGKYSVMSYVNNPNVSVEVYIDNSLVKSQSINLDQISEKNGTSSNEISTTINI